MSSVYVIIPARSGSKGVPSKNIRPIGNLPLIAYSILAAKKMSGVDRVFVSTNSEEYAELARSYGAEVPFLRPDEISGDQSTDLECMIHALDHFKSKENKVPTHLIHLRPTTPLRKVSVLNDALKNFLKSDNGSYTALRSAHEMPETAYKCLEVDQPSGCLTTVFKRDFNIEKSNVSRQLFPKTYSPNGYVDILKTDTLLNKEMIHGDRVMAYITPQVTEVDTLEEFGLLEYELGKATDPEYSIYK